MNSFKTPKGTELPLLSLKGKMYLQVPHRIMWFREEHPTWRIVTEFIVLDDKKSICKATLLDEKGCIMATAHKREDQQHFQDHTEKSETGAIGRALALIGYGTQFALDLDEGDRLADSPIQLVTTTPPVIVNPIAPSIIAPSQGNQLFCQTCSGQMRPSKYANEYYCSKNSKHTKVPFEAVFEKEEPNHDLDMDAMEEEIDKDFKK